MGLFSLFKGQKNSFCGACRNGLLSEYESSMRKEGLSDELMSKCTEIYNLARAEYERKVAEIERISEPASSERFRLEDWLDETFDVSCMHSPQEYLDKIFKAYNKWGYHINWYELYSEEGEKWYNHSLQNRDVILSPDAQRLIDLYLTDKEFNRISIKDHQAIVGFIERLRREKPVLQRMYFPTYMEYKALFPGYINYRLDFEKVKTQSYENAMKALKEEQESTKNETGTQISETPFYDERPTTKQSQVRIVFQDPEL